MLSTRNLIFIAVFFAFIACNNEGESNQEESNNNTVVSSEAFKKQVDSLRMVIDLAWDTMIAEDDQKLDYLKRACDEAVYVLNANSAQKDKLHERVEALRAYRYDNETVAQSDLIDKYDSATNVVIAEVFDWIESYDSTYSVPLIADLHADIHKMDDQVLHRRGDYDDPAIFFNKLLKEQKDSFDALGEPYASQEAYPLFILMPEI